jgi:hypothetical protein
MGALDGNKGFSLLHGINDVRQNYSQTQQERKLGIMFVESGAFVGGIGTFSSNGERVDRNHSSDESDKGGGKGKTKEEKRALKRRIFLEHGCKGLISIPEPLRQRMLTELDEKVGTDGLDSFLVNIDRIARAGKELLKLTQEQRESYMTSEEQHYAFNTCPTNGGQWVEECIANPKGDEGQAFRTMSNKLGRLQKAVRMRMKQDREAG